MSKVFHIAKWYYKLFIFILSVCDIKVGRRDSDRVIEIVDALISAAWIIRDRNAWQQV